MYFEINYDEPLNKRISKLKDFLYALHITQSKNTKDFLLHAVDTRPGFSNSTFEVFDVIRGQKKGLWKFLLFRALKNFFVMYFQKLMWFYLLATKDSLLGKV